MTSTPLRVGTVAAWVVLPLLGLGVWLYLGGLPGSDDAPPDRDGDPQRRMAALSGGGGSGSQQPVAGEGEDARSIPLHLPAGLLPASIWTVGDLPPKADRVLVTLDARGAITVDGRPCTLEKLVPTLAARTELRRDDDGSSSLHYLVAADRSVAWQKTAWVLQAAAHPDVMMYRVHFVVRHRGDEELGQLACFLPKAVQFGTGRFRDRPKLAARVVPGETTSDPERFLEPVRAWLAKYPDHAAPEIDADATAPTGLVLELLDVFHRAGAGFLTLTGQPPPGSAFLRDGSQTGSGTRARSIHLRGGGQPSVTALVSPATPVPRVRGALAGFTEPTDLRDAPPELEEEVPPSVEDR